MNYLVLTTGQGSNFGRSVTSRLRTRLKGHGDHAVYRYRVVALDEAFARHPEFNPTNTIIHSRAAHPTAQWMQRLVRLEEQGYKVVNCTSTLRLTSDKFRFWQRMRDEGLARELEDGDGDWDVLTYLLNWNTTAPRLREMLDHLDSGRPSRPDWVILKPRVSRGQGAFVERLRRSELTFDHLQEYLRRISGSAILQQYIGYEAIYRVTVIGGVAVEGGITVDRPTADDWKVSVCLNPRQVRFDGDDALRSFLCRYAQDIQRAVGGEVNFIDIYRDDDLLTVSEVNTACNLARHTRLTGTDFADEIARYLSTLWEDPILVQGGLA